MLKAWQFVSSGNTQPEWLFSTLVALRNAALPQSVPHISSGQLQGGELAPNMSPWHGEVLFNPPWGFPLTRLTMEAAVPGLAAQTPHRQRGETEVTDASVNI